ncbi:MAG: hypothetical protein JO047_14240 [Alphaproteobacteria bacterium]|nr:hypothetical protein [Alphaproteobacteria bacterium]
MRTILLTTVVILTMRTLVLATASSVVMATAGTAFAERAAVTFKKLAMATEQAPVAADWRAAPAMMVGSAEAAGRGKGLHLVQGQHPAAETNRRSAA